MMSMPVSPVEAAAADLAARIVMESTGLRGDGVLRGVRCHVRVLQSRVHITLTDLPPEAVDPALPDGPPTPRGARIAERLSILAYLANHAEGVTRPASFVIPPSAILRAAGEARRLAEAQLRRVS
jgi:hypothetical protein